MDKVERDRIFNIWTSMKNRCYNQDNPSYKSYGAKGVTVCDEWLEFESFYEWYKANYYTVGTEIMCLDKDILDKHNMVYSPDKCMIVPIRINNMFVSNKATVKTTPKGIRPTTSGRYSVSIGNINSVNKSKNDYCGTYDTVEKAYEVYKKCKKEIIIGVAEEYKDKITEKLYEALINYEVE